MSTAEESYEAVTTGIAGRDRTDRVRLEVTGPDRAKFLHNLTTQDVKRLPPGEGREAFITSPQGKTLGYVTLLVEADRILVRTDREGWGPVLPHLGKYGVFDEVTLDEISAATFELHLCGPCVEEILRAAGLAPPPPGELRHATGRVGDVAVRVVRESLTALPGFTLIGDRCGLEPLRSALAAASTRAIVPIDDATFEVLRIEAGTPVAGRDVTPENLPQEVARDALAINFVKGCYLGQETVARIDAMGHVNRLLRGLLLDTAAPPPPGSAILQADGRPVGAVTSAAFAPVRGQVVALGYVRASHARAGTAVQVAVPGAEPSAQAVAAVVSDLPMARN
jgi:tRNA-modifying protein YgfZ